LWLEGLRELKKMTSEIELTIFRLAGLHLNQLRYCAPPNFGSSNGDDTDVKRLEPKKHNLKTKVERIQHSVFAS
jgi:hypothetical protein